MEIFIFLAIGFICAALVRKWQVKEDSQTAFRNSEMRLERARISARVMNEAYATGRLNLLESIYTKELYRQELATAERLKRFDMYKVIEMQDACVFWDNRLANLYDGKVNWGKVQLSCSYLCEYKSGSQTLFRIAYPKIKVILEFLKSAVDRNVKIVHCLNCGNEMTMMGDYMQCPYCRTQFNVDSPSWIVHGWSYQSRREFKIKNTAKTEQIVSAIAAFSMILFAPFLMLLLPIVALAGMIAFIVFIFYAVRQILRALTWERMKHYDSNFSQNLLKTRIWNLVQTVGYTYKEDERKYQDMVTQNMEQQLEEMRRSRKYQKKELLDLYITKFEATKFRVKRKEQLATFECVTELIELENQMVSMEKKKLKVTVSRPRESMTPLLLQESHVSCGSCGASMDVLDVRCPYCGRIVNVNGWKLDRIKGL